MDPDFQSSPHSPRARRGNECIELFVIAEPGHRRVSSAVADAFPRFRLFRPSWPSPNYAAPDDFVMISSIEEYSNGRFPIRRRDRLSAAPKSPRHAVRRRQGPARLSSACHGSGRRCASSPRRAAASRTRRTAGRGARRIAAQGRDASRRYEPHGVARRRLDRPRFCRSAARAVTPPARGSGNRARADAAISILRLLAPRWLQQPRRPW